MPSVLWNCWFNNRNNSASPLSKGLLMDGLWDQSLLAIDDTGNIKDVNIGLSIAYLSQIRVHQMLWLVDNWWANGASSATIQYETDIIVRLGLVLKYLDLYPVWPIETYPCVYVCCERYCDTIMLVVVSAGITGDRCTDSWPAGTGYCETHPRFVAVVVDVVVVVVVVTVFMVC